MTNNLTNKRVVILGLARQGVALARYLVADGASVTVSDLRSASVLADELAMLEDLPIQFVLGQHPPDMLDGADALSLSGGVPIDAPIVREAQRRGIRLINDAQIFLERCPAPVIGITGSAGKSTTTALVGAMCRAEARHNTWVGGNIGNPLISDLAHIAPADRVVIELSSFQLEIMTLGTPVAAILNLTPNHLDRHKTMEAYATAKGNLLRHQPLKGVAVLNADNPRVSEMAALARGRVTWFSGRRKMDDGTWLQGETLFLRSPGSEQQAICSLGDIRLRGYHNLLNTLAACAIAAAAGLPVDAMREGIATFEGLPHRLEVVDQRAGVTYVNDSIATAPERVQAALQSFDRKQPIVLLLGGQDKDLPWRELMDEAVRRCHAIIAFGEAGEMIAREAYLACRALHELEWPVLKHETDLAGALEVAIGHALPGSVVLLAPGGTSFDAYNDFAERGEHFRSLVSNL